MRLRKLAAVSTLALTAAGFTALAPTAHAATAAFKCTVPIGPDTSEFEFDSAATLAPVKVQYGQSVAAKGSITVTVPADLAELAYGFLNARSASGSGTFAFSTASAPVAIPSTPINETGPLVMQAPAAVTVKGTKVGTSTVTLKNYAAKVSLKKEDGTEAMALDATCVPKNGVPLAAGTLTTAKASTTTALKATGLKKAAKVVVNVKAKFGTKAAGKVTFKVGKKSKTVAVKGGKATVKIKGLKKGKNKVVVTYKGDANHLTSKKAGSVKVK